MPPPTVTAYQYRDIEARVARLERIAELQEKANREMLLAIDEWEKQHAADRRLILAQAERIAGQ
jgi:hypothetical protein